MYKEKKIIYIKALTPIHAGAGQTLENVDMPIQRERHSNIPKIEASSLKGSIKHEVYNKLKIKNEKNWEKDFYYVFGPEDSDNDYASAIGFTDAKLLFFPMRSATDVFKLITCPYVLNRWIEDLRIQDDLDEKLKSIVQKVNINSLNIPEGVCITQSDDNIILEEYIFEKCINGEKNPIKINKKLLEIFNKIDGVNSNKIVILNDTDFIDLVTMYTEIITRNKIDVKTGTAENTGLFTEEYLPTETILYFDVLASPTFNKDNKKTSKQVLEYFTNNVDEVFQVGGNATIGKGFVKRSVEVGAKSEGGNSNEEAAK